VKIGLVVPGFSAGPDDWCIPVLVDAVRQISAHAEVHVFPLRYPSIREPYRVHGAAVHPVGGGVARGVARSNLMTSALRNIVAQHRRGQFDVLHGIWADEPGFVATAASTILRVPAVVSVMGGELVGFNAIAYGGRLSKANRVLTKVALKRAVRVTAASSESVHAARRIAGRKSANRVVQQVWGVDPRLFGDPREVKPLAGTFRVLSAASLVAVKGHRTLLEAMRRLRAEHPGIRLHIAGDGPERDALAARARVLGIGDRVTFHASVRREHMGGFYRGADLLVVSSLHEMQPAVLLEAALCSLPAVSTRVGMAPDFPALATEPVQPGDPEQLAWAIASAVSMAAQPAPAGSDETSSRLQLLGCEARQLGERKYLSSHTACSLLKLYGEVAGEASAPERPFQIADLLPSKADEFAGLRSAS
jgi:glycosyltransferase involved in cell wall biosynthesis